MERDGDHHPVPPTSCKRREYVSATLSETSLKAIPAETLSERKFHARRGDSFHLPATSRIQLEPCNMKEVYA